MDTKVCSKCKKEKPRSEFNTRGKAQWNKGKLRSQCKVCEKSYQSQTPEKVLARVYATRKRNKEFLWKYLLEHPCIDCGETDPIVLEPDHLDPTQKTDGVSRLVHNTRSLAAIEAELDKCEIVCANCHRRRTALQQGWFSGELSPLPVSSL